jgi:signal peptidase I
MKLQKWSDYYNVLFLGLFIAIIVRWTILSFYYFPSESMIPGILPHHYVLVNKLAYGLRLTPGGSVYFEQKVQTGDLVLFALPSNEEKKFVKRVIAAAGDFVEIKAGRVWINGAPLNVRVKNKLETVFEEKFRETVWEIFSLRLHSPTANFNKTQVPEGHFFVLNDNRDQLEDSRTFGMVPAKFLSGKVLVSFSVSDILRTHAITN